MSTVKSGVWLVDVRSPLGPRVNESSSVTWDRLVHLLS